MRLSSLALALLATALFAHGTPAAPWPSPRAGAGLAPGASLTSGASGAVAPPGVSATRGSEPDATRSACGTNLDAVMAALVRHAAREALAPLPTTYSQDTNGIAVLEDDGTFFYPNSGGDPVLDIAAVCRAFYASHGDDYDQVAFYVASSMTQFIVAPTALAASWMVRNDTQGLGLSVFDVGATLGSPARLKAFLTMNSLARYPDDPEATTYSPGDPLGSLDVLEHEFGHQWLAYVWVDSAGTPSHALLGRDWQHWNFFTDSDSSVMGGNDWLALPADSFRTDGGYANYSPLDQYLMGLRTRAELDSFFVVDAPVAFEPPGSYTPPTDPISGLGCRGRATWWKLADIERRNGPRVPDGAVAPRHFRVAIGLIVAHGTTPTPADLAKLQVIRTGFPQRFTRDTQGRGTVDVTLASHAGAVDIVHTPLQDIEGSAGSRSVGALVTIVGGGMALHVAPGSVQLHWRTSPEAPFNALTMSPAGPDSFTVVAPLPTSGTVAYWLSASSDSAGIAAQLPAAGPSAPFTFAVGPDVTPPAITVWPVARQGSDRLPQTLLARVRDNVGVDSVWCENSVDGGPVASLPVVRVGTDSFAVALGAGLGRGQKLAWRFVARDVATAHNLAFSAPGYDTLRVVHDYIDDFENPASNFIHGPVRWSWRDAWHVETLPIAYGAGAAYHCGGASGEPYGPHGDATVWTPWIYGIVPGTTLTFDERHALEQESSTLAFDAARLELQTGSGDWQPAEPVPGYTHAMDEPGMGIAPGEACWSGTTPGWVTRTLDLSPWAPGPVRLRVRQVSDDLVGYDGTWVDHVHVHFPDDFTAAPPPPPAALAAGLVWPNPSRGAFALPIALPSGARVEWSLHDVQGRRVAMLWAGALAAGRSTLSAQAPAALAPGLYFSRVLVAGRPLAAQRVALTR